MNGAILLPFERTESTLETNDELILGRLPDFCPEAFQPQILTSGLLEQEQKRQRKSQINYNLLTEPQIPLPVLDSLLKEKIEKQLIAKVNLYKNQASIGSISLLNTYRQVNCVTLSDSGAVMATGMSDSTIKVFVLSKKQHDVLTVEDMVKEQVQENIRQLHAEAELAD
jgi:transcription initiation factor TFIID subunit 5